MKKYAIGFVGYILGCFLVFPIAVAITYHQPWFLLVYIPPFLLLMIAVLKGDRKNED